MEFKTARWWSLLLSLVAIVSITTYFYLDSKDAVPALLTLIIKPLMMITLFPTVFLLLTSLLATRKSEERIEKHHFQNAFVILVCLVAFRVFVTFIK